MVIVKTIEDFKRYNENDLRSFFSYITEIRDKNLQDDAIQDFYVRLIESKALDGFDASIRTHGTEQRMFNSYILTLFCWGLPVQAKKNSLLSHVPRIVNENETDKKKKNAPCDVISSVKNNESSDQEEVDIWEVVHCRDFNSSYRISNDYKASHVNEDVETEAELYLKSFISYIKKTEPKKKAERMITYIERKIEGCKGTDLAVMLKVSNNMIKFIKNDIYSHFKNWNSLNASYN